MGSGKCSISSMIGNGLKFGSGVNDLHGVLGWECPVDMTVKFLPFILRWVNFVIASNRATTRLKPFIYFLSWPR